jgi:uncharacterized protein (DUF302 family)
MKANFQVEHVTITSSRGFDDFTHRLESALGRFDMAAFRGSLGELQAALDHLKNTAGEEKLLLFDTLDHGGILSFAGNPRRVKQYVVGNPLIAAKMTRHDLRAALYAPLRLCVYEADGGKTGVDYDLPSSLFGQFRNAQIDEVARSLDEKLNALIGKAD